MLYLVCAWRNIRQNSRLVSEIRCPMLLVLVRILSGSGTWWRCLKGSHHVCGLTVVCIVYKPCHNTASCHAGGIHCDYYFGFLWPLLLTRLNLNPSMDKELYALLNVRWNYLSIPKLQIEMREWMNNFIPHFIMDVIAHPWWDWSKSMLVKGATGIKQLTPLTDSKIGYPHVKSTDTQSSNTL